MKHRHRIPLALTVASGLMLAYAWARRMQERLAYYMAESDALAQLDAVCMTEDTYLQAADAAHQLAAGSHLTRLEAVRKITELICLGVIPNAGGHLDPTELYSLLYPTKED